MAGGAVKGPVVGRSCRVVIRADRIAGTQPLPFKSTLQHLRKPPAYLDKTSKGPLVTSGGGVNEYTDGGCHVAEAGRYVDALVDGAGGIAAIDGDLCNQRMGERMREQVAAPNAPPACPAWWWGRIGPVLDADRRQCFA